MYITKKVKNLRIIENVLTTHTTCTVNISQILELYYEFIYNLTILIDEGRLFHRVLALKCTELRPRQNDLIGGKNSLVPFCKADGIGFSLK